MVSDKRELDKIFKRRNRYEIPDWQRTEVWDVPRQRLLIDSILRGWKLPKFYFLQVSNEDEQYEVLDGQQRLMAIFDFFEGELSLSADAEKEFGARTYADLPPKVGDAFDDFDIEFDVITNATEEERRQFFQRLQLGLALTSSEQLNSISSALRDFCRRLAKHNFFKNKTSVSDKRYGHFDICTKVAAIQIEGLDVGLRFEELKAVFESQKDFSSRSMVAKRLVATFDYLNRVFPSRSPLLRHRTIVQSFTTLTAKLIDSGNADGYEKKLHAFFVNFMEQLEDQVERGQQATNSDYVEFQRTMNANVKSGSRAREQILLRKLLSFDPKAARLLGPGAVAESGAATVVRARADTISDLVAKINTAHSAKHGIDLFKATNRTAAALKNLGKQVDSLDRYGEFVDDLYFLFWESPGDRLVQNRPPTFIDVNTLRTHLRHDVDHGKAKRTAASRKKHGTVFSRYAGGSTPETLDPDQFTLAQLNLLNAIEGELRNLP